MPYDKVWDLLTNAEHVIHATADDGVEDSDKKMVEACIAKSMARFKDRMQRRGYTGDSKVCMGWPVHQALHEIFGTCDTELAFLVLMERMLGADGPQDHALYEVVAKAVELGFAFGGMFTLEDLDAEKEEPDVDLNLHLD